jgi:hypothetical protein
MELSHRLGVTGWTPGKESMAPPSPRALLIGQEMAPPGIGGALQMRRPAAIRLPAEAACRFASAAWEKRKNVRDHGRQPLRSGDPSAGKSMRRPHRRLLHPPVRLARDRMLFGRRRGREYGGGRWLGSRLCPCSRGARLLVRICHSWCLETAHFLRLESKPKCRRRLQLRAARACGHARGAGAPFRRAPFFVGEATHAFDSSTAHGARDSGVRAAQQAMACYAPPATVLLLQRVDGVVQAFHLSSHLRNGSAGRALRYCLAAVTRQIVLDRSSATISAPRLSTVTPTGRPRVLPSSPMKPSRKSTGGPDGRPLLNGTKTTL